MTGKATNPQPALEEKCEKCNGTGWYSEVRGDRERCGLCEGAGYVPTAFGEQVLALMRHNFKPMLEDVMQ